MKRAMLIGFALAVASSSAYAYVVTQKYRTSSSDGAPGAVLYYELKCNSGAKGQASTTQTGPVANYYAIAVPVYNSKAYKSLDAAAKVACGE